MSEQKFGYKRVSTIDQNTDRQLVGIDIEENNMFIDKCSGKSAHRPQLEECLKRIREGDTLYVHSIDRLARNLQDLLNIIEKVNANKATIVFIKENLTFGCGKNSDMQRFQLQILGAVAQFERSMILERQREGIAIAKKEGKYKGRKPSLSAEQIEQAKALVAAGQNKSKIARLLGVSRTTLYAVLKEAK